MKTARILVLFVLLSAFTLSICADEFNPLKYEYHNPDITVEFAESLNISAERQEKIADEIAGIDSMIVSGNGLLLPDNLICTLFGHDLSTTTVTATHHKVNVHDPRCLVEVYHVSACSRCNYTNPELVGSVYIFCCPED
jgi:hypothetical protein